MSQHGIIMSGFSVHALAEDRKGQTRRVMRVQPKCRPPVDGGSAFWTCPTDPVAANPGAWRWVRQRNDGKYYDQEDTFRRSRYAVGDLLWMKEKLIRLHEGHVAYAWDGRRATKWDGTDFRLVQWSETGWSRDWLPPASCRAGQAAYLWRSLASALSACSPSAKRMRSRRGFFRRKIFARPFLAMQGKSPGKCAQRPAPIFARQTSGRGR